MLPAITTASAVVVQADSEAQLLALWLHGRPATTARAYRREAARFLAFVGKPLRQVKLGDVQAFADSVTGKPATAARAVNAVKSLCGFAHKIGFLAFDVARPVRLPRRRNELAARILAEADVHRLLALEGNARNSALLRLLYAGGLRVSEACGLRWRDVQARAEGGQVTVFGKGGKTRAVLLSAATFQQLEALRAGQGGEAPVFASAQGGPLGVVQAWRIVKAAAARAGLAAVSPHWLRHAHASHALDRGAPVHVVRDTLGHGSLQTTSAYLHARPGDSSARYLAV